MKPKFKATPENIGLIVIARLRDKLSGLITERFIQDITDCIIDDLTPLLENQNGNAK